MDDLQGRISKARVTESTDEYIQLRSDTDNIGIRLKFDDAENVWLLTAFERGQRRAERSSARLRELWADSTSSTPTTRSPEGDNQENSASPLKKQASSPVFEGKRADDTSILSMQEQDELAALRAQFRDKIKTQLNSGLDPELVSIGAKMATIYIKAGARKFRDLIRAMMEDLGLTFDQAQPYARNAYNQVRDDMELDDQDVSGMDDARSVMDAVKELRKQQKSLEALVSDPKSDKVEPETREAKADAAREHPGIGVRHAGQRGQQCGEDTATADGAVR